MERKKCSCRLSCESLSEISFFPRVYTYGNRRGRGTLGERRVQRSPDKTKLFYRHSSATQGINPPQGNVYKKDQKFLYQGVHFHSVFFYSLKPLADLPGSPEVRAFFPYAALVPGSPLSLAFCSDSFIKFFVCTLSRKIQLLLSLVHSSMMNKVSDSQVTRCEVLRVGISQIQVHF